MEKLVGILYFLYIISVIVIGSMIGIIVGAFLGPKMILDSIDPFKSKGKNKSNGIQIDEDPFKF